MSVMASGSQPSACSRANSRHSSPPFVCVASQIAVTPARKPARRIGDGRRQRFVRQRRHDGIDDLIHLEEKSRG